MNEVLKTIFDRQFESFFLIAGPCAVESQSICDEVAGQMKEICAYLNVPYIFKSSYRKANRTSDQSFSGIGDDHAIEILKQVGQKNNVPLTTDVHETGDVALVKEIVDVIQIPAYLCRQTALLKSAGQTGKCVNIKKGQFMSASGMIYAAEKIRSTGNEHVMLTERGNFFGYKDIVVDGRNIDVMSRTEITVIDVTHATQRPNQHTGTSGGNPDDVELMGKIGLSAGALGVFLEVHPDPSKAKSDASSMIKLSEIAEILERWVALTKSVRSIYA